MAAPRRDGPATKDGWRTAPLREEARIGGRDGGEDEENSRSREGVVASRATFKIFLPSVGTCGVFTPARPTITLPVPRAYRFKISARSTSAILQFRARDERSPTTRQDHVCVIGKLKKLFVNDKSDSVASVRCFKLGHRDVTDRS